jgi:hypothetical protein
LSFFVIHTAKVVNARLPADLVVDKFGEFTAVVFAEFLSSFFVDVGVDLVVTFDELIKVEFKADLDVVVDVEFLEPDVVEFAAKKIIFIKIIKNY